ncbi:MAG: N-acetylmuramoyl-L-alanine amidase [Pseudomonadota bacterium]
MRHAPSPNHGPRQGRARPSLVVLHYTAMASAEAALTRLCDPAVEVSAHYLIGGAGEIWALVPEDRRAWHAGAGAWGGILDVNSHAIGIELDNCGARPFPNRQITALEALLDDVMQRWSILPHGVVAHSDVAPTRKRDPGPRFDWRRLARGGRSVWAEGAPDPRGGSGSDMADPTRFHRAARQFGYRCAPGQAAALLDAFRLRFRPWAGGVLTPADISTIEVLAARWPGPA